MDPSPVAVMRGVHRLVSQLPLPEMATLIYLVFDPATRRLRFANAGHPPALVIGGSGSTYLGDGLAPPVGVTADDLYAEASYQLTEGATLLLYTDGLVERRRESIQDGLDLLRLEAAAHSAADPEELCDRLLSSLVEQGSTADDIAILVMRPALPRDGALHLNLPAEPQMLAQMRRSLRQWLRDKGVAPANEDEVLVACGEACANVVQHAYDGASGYVEIDADLNGNTVHVSVRDRGQWRPAGERGGGWGQSLMGALMDSVEVQRGADGTQVQMCREVQVGDRS
jgi:anti-sigma regulatory factor (Ser/Thr protein kinase)